MVGVCIHFLEIHISKHINRVFFEGQILYFVLNFRPPYSTCPVSGHTARGFPPTLQPFYKMCSALA